MQIISPDAYLKPLENLQQADVPEFLFTRIQQAIVNSHIVSRPQVILAGAAFCIMLLFNVAVLLRSGHSPDKNPGNALVFEVSTNNDIYK